jgi:tetratricopeptide (TPR) repeat protein
MKLLYKLLLIFCCNILYANDLIESQPEILFKFDKLKKSQKNLALQVDFNKAVLLLSKGEYKEAIELFKKTEGIMYVPSNLNIGIAYYKLNSIDNAIFYKN